MKIRILLLLALYVGVAASALAQDAPENFQEIYAGKIAGKYAIVMRLSRNGKDLTGSYKYLKQNKALYLKGTIDSLGHFAMSESVGMRENTGKFSGTLSGTTIAGEWISTDGAKKLSFEAHEFSKKEALQAATGTHYLTAISGSPGNKALFDISPKSDGVWAYSSGPADDDSDRETETLSGDAVKLLESMYIKVGADLSIQFFAKDKILLEVPFTETGMDYRFEDADRKIPFGNELERLSPSVTFVDQKLYLAAMHHVDYSQTISVPGAIDRGVMTLRYDPYDNTFEIWILGCCGKRGNNSFYFK